MEQKDFLSFGALQTENAVYYHPSQFILQKSTFLFLQDLSCNPVLFPSIERFCVEHNVGTVARL